MYYNDDSILTAIWNVSDAASQISNMFYKVGRYPGGSDIEEITWTNASYISASEVSAETEGDFLCLFLNKKFDGYTFYCFSSEIVFSYHLEKSP